MEQISDVMRQIERLKFLQESTQNIPKKSSEKKESYKCIKCQDKGFVEITYDDGIAYRECECKEIEKMRDILKASGIDDEYQKISIQQYKTYNAVTHGAKQAALDYLMKFDSIRNDRKNSIAFLGQVGAGKTHLGIGMANVFMQRSIPVRYMSYRDSIMELKQNITDEEYYQNLIQKYKTAKVLLIDDLFKGGLRNGKMNESDLSIMFEIINHRYLTRMPMIISSEYMPDRLIEFDEAIGSRIMEMAKDYIITFEGQENNFRLRGIL